MSAEKPLFVVLGATGNQGGSVLSYLLSLSPSSYKLRGTTRNISSPKAVSLTSLGVEMVAADFDDSSSLDIAFAGASAIFSVTDFWQTFFTPAQREKAAAAGQHIGAFNREYETLQNKNIIDAAAKVPTLERFIFSSLPNTNKLSDGKYKNVWHFEGKSIAEEYGKMTYPELWKKTSVFIAGYFLENYFEPSGSLFLPKLDKSKDSLTLSVAEPLATTPLPFYSVTNDTGPLVYSLLLSPPGKRMIGVKKWLSFRDSGKLIAQFLNKSIGFIDVNPSFDVGDPDVARDYQEMMAFCVEFRFDGWNVDKSVVQPGDLEEKAKLESAEEWFGKQDWEKFIPTES